ncbi:hypothetical protein D3C78_1309490 [compost metagenome]
MTKVKHIDFSMLQMTVSIRYYTELVTLSLNGFKRLKRIVHHPCVRHVVFIVISFKLTHIQLSGPWKRIDHFLKKSFFRAITIRITLNHIGY